MLPQEGLPVELQVSPEQRARNGQTTVVVGMSGGVDSSVVACLLHAQGYRVIGLFMKNWDETDESGQCPATRDFQDVERVCRRLGIPYYGVEFVKEYWDQVFSQFLEDYRSGFTPNPDVLCNREIKFNVFMKKAMELGADFLATGHYCRVARVNGRAVLLKGLDPGKDQSYFVHAVGSDALERVLFPIGDLHKSQVREIARRYGLATAEKKDSTGICFIGERDFREFLSKYVAIRPGHFQTLAGQVVGRHQGAAFYTLGQRKGLGLGGEGEAWYVVGKDSEKNVVLVERGDRHPALYCDELWAEGVHFISGAAPAAEGGVFRCRAKVRYRQPDQDCQVELLADGRVRVVFDEPQRAVTPGQSVVFYQNDVCLGGARITRAGASYWEQGRELPSPATSLRRSADDVSDTARLATEAGL